MSEGSAANSLPKLTSLEIEPGELNFDPDITEYTIQVEEGTNKVLVRAKAADEQQYKVNGNSGLVPGENLVTITVWDADGTENIYRVHVIVKEQESVHQQSQETDKKEEQESGREEDTKTSLIEKQTAGNNHYFSIGIIGCAGVAVAVCIAFFVRRHRIRRAKEKLREKRLLERQKRQEQMELVRRQEEELLRQIELLTKKSREGKGTLKNGLRIIELDEEDYETLIKGREEPYDDSGEES